MSENREITTDAGQSATFPRFADIVKDLENVYTDDGIICWLTDAHLMIPGDEAKVACSPIYLWTHGERRVVADACQKIAWGDLNG